MFEDYRRTASRNLQSSIFKHFELKILNIFKNFYRDGRVEVSAVFDDRVYHKWEFNYETGWAKGGTRWGAAAHSMADATI